VLLSRDGGPLKLMSALGWALTWALGAAIGVALGGYLTLVSGSGAPGQTALDPTTDLFVLPLVAFGIVLVVHLVGQTIAGFVRAHRASSPGDDRDQGE
jgi:hypothetical protein